MIRNSNGPLLVAGIEQAGATPVDLGIVGDESAALAARIAEGLACDVLLLSGGVSAGLLDLVPEALTAAGVEQVFHKVKLKPGKPLWFGVRPDDAAPRLVFGLPGNPVSTLVCFELFVRPALQGLAGRGARPRETISAELTMEHTHWGGRPTYHPVRLERSGGRARVEPLPWYGSADLHSLAAANALAHFPAGDKTHRRGDTVDVLPLQ